MLKFLRRRHERWYRHNPWHLVLDLGAFLVIIILLICFWAWRGYRPTIDLVSNAPIHKTAPAQLEFSLAKTALKPGEVIKLKVKYHNQGQVLNAINLSFASLNEDYVFVPAGSNLGALGAKESGEKEISLTFKGPGRVGDKINWQARIEYQGASGNFSDFQILPALQIMPDLQASAKIYYTSPQGDQLGAGPLPPQVDLPTNYWVSWEVSGFNPNLENFIMSAKLPSYVNLTDKKSLLAGNLKYNQAIRQVVWALPKFSSDTTGQAGFEIQLIPTLRNVGQVLDLLKDMKYSAIDKVSGVEITGTLDNLSTDLEFDRLNRGQGKVAS